MVWEEHDAKARAVEVPSGERSEADMMLEHSYRTISYEHEERIAKAANARLKRDLHRQQKAARRLEQQANRRGWSVPGLAGVRRWVPVIGFRARHA